jgi:hypothetical protein
MGFVGAMGRPLIHRAHAQTPSFGTAYRFAISVRDLRIPNFPSRFLAHKSCLEAQFDGFTEVSRCDPEDNSWCCAGSPGQGLGGPDCCTTNLTTSLEPYPFSSIDAFAQTGAATTTSLMSTAQLTSSSLSSSLTSFFTSTSSLVSPSRSSITSQGPTSPSVAPTSGSNHGNASNSGLSKSDLIAICIGVPVGVATIISTIFIVINFNRKRKRERGRPARPRQATRIPLRTLNRNLI